MFKLLFATEKIESTATSLWHHTSTHSNASQIPTAQMTAHQHLAGQGVSMVALLSTPGPKGWYKLLFGPFCVPVHCCLERPFIVVQ